jgi:methylated-DNA-[protein]-cysteine S-methyltransferase
MTKGNGRDHNGIVSSVGGGSVQSDTSPDLTSLSVAVSTFEVELGSMIAGATDRALLFVEFSDRPKLDMRLSRLRAKMTGGFFEGDNPILESLRNELDRYFAGDLMAFTTAVDPLGTPFQQRVWRALMAIPLGQTMSYGALAEQLGCPGAVRAVASANADNYVAILIPCHRVIGRNGKLTGYAGGLHRKRHLLDLEARVVGRPVQSRMF